MRSLRVLLLRGGDVDVRRRPDRGYLLGDGVVHGDRRGRRYGRRLLLGFLDGGDRLGSLLDDSLGLLLLDDHLAILLHANRGDNLLVDCHVRGRSLRRDLSLRVLDGRRADRQDGLLLRRRDDGLGELDDLDVLLLLVVFELRVGEVRDVRQRQRALPRLLTRAPALLLSRPACLLPPRVLLAPVPDVIGDDDVDPGAVRVIRSRRQRPLRVGRACADDVHGGQGLVHARVLLRLAAPVLQRCGPLARGPSQRPAVFSFHQIVAETRAG